MQLNCDTYPVAGYRPLQDPPRADLVRAQRLLGCFRAVLSLELDPVVSQGRGVAGVGWGGGRPPPSLTGPSPAQEGRLLEKESSEWQLQGQPTVLLTLAHIFHRFAPLLVRAWGRQGLHLHLGGAPCDLSPQTPRMSPSKEEGLRAGPRKGAGQRLPGRERPGEAGRALGGAVSQPKGKVRLRGAARGPRVQLCVGLAAARPGTPRGCTAALTVPPSRGRPRAAQGVPGGVGAHGLPAGRRGGGQPRAGAGRGGPGPGPPVALHGGEAPALGPRPGGSLGGPGPAPPA